jgi:lysophospholipase L1-like esterase
MPGFYRRCQDLPDFVESLRRGQRHWMCTIGDSNACNTGFTHGAKQWPELLHSAFKDAAGTQTLMLANAGVSGDSVIEALARFDHDITRVHPGLTFIALGSNDANRLDDQVFGHGLNEMLDRLAASGGLVVMLTPIPIWERTPSRIWPDDGRLKAKVGRIRAIADARSLPLVDLYGLWQEAERSGGLRMAEVMSDAVHANALGHRLVCRQLLPAFGFTMPLV